MAEERERKRIGRRNRLGRKLRRNDSAAAAAAPTTNRVSQENGRRIKEMETAGGKVGNGLLSIIFNLLYHIAKYFFSETHVWVCA